MEKRSSRNWWVMKWYDTAEEGLAWEPPSVPKLKYCCWRIHECPTTQKIHGHILFQFSSVMRYETLVNKGYHNVKWLKDDGIATRRQYCIDDNHIPTHRKDPNGPKGVLAAFREIGQWNEPRVAPVKRKLNDIYLDAFAAQSYEEGVKILMAQAPRDMAIHGDTIERRLKKKFPKKFVHLYKMTDFNADPIEMDTRAVVIWGNTALGKTQYALCHFKNPLLVKHIDKLKRFIPEFHDGIVFDEITFKHIPVDSVKTLLDWDEEADIHCRYNNAEIPRGTPKIFCSQHENPFYEINIPEEDRDAVERRCIKVHVTEKLFK